jgi:hypothetical protein
MDLLAITIKGDLRLNRIISTLTVQQSQAFSNLQKLESKPVEIQAMWDTGSMVSCISHRLAALLGLTAVDTMTLTSLQGSQDVDVYS